MSKTASKQRYFGPHVSAAGGLEVALRNGMELGVNTIQIHPSPPQRWNTKPFAAGVENEFNLLRPQSGVEKIYFHGIYLINLATPDSGKLKMAILSLANDLDLSARIGGSGVIFHVGSLKDEPDEKVGFSRCAQAIDEILDRSPASSRLLLEVAAGAGKIIGDRIEELGQIFEQVKDTTRLGFALDTQHMWASGYNWQTSLDQIIEQIDSVFSLSKVWAIHLNDSKTACGSKTDRHENIGAGLIGEETMRAIFTHEKLVDIPFVLETPALKELSGAATEVEKLRSFLT